MLVCQSCGATAPAGRYCGQCGGTLAEGAPDELVGTKLGPYQITRVLGEGGMGRVYMGEHPGIGSRVAIKVLSAACAEKPELVKRFFHEAKAVNQIRHESIVNVLDLATLPDGRPYIIMEFLDGAPLSSILQKGPLPLGSALRLATEVLGALAAAHAQGIVHRDLKPDNIFVSPQGRTKVLDFGIAKLLAPETAGTATPTQTGALLGTPHYMSPEQAKAQPVDHRADIYAMGLILFECVTGRCAFEGASLYELLHKQVNDPPPYPKSLRPDLPDPYQDIIMAALVKDPDRRIPNAEEFIRRLGGVSKMLTGDAWAPIGTRIDAASKQMAVMATPSGAGSRPGHNPGAGPMSGHSSPGIAGPAAHSPPGAGGPPVHSPPGIGGPPSQAQQLSSAPTPYAAELQPVQHAGSKVPTHGGSGPPTQQRIQPTGSSSRMPLVIAAVVMLLGAGVTAGVLAMGGSDDGGTRTASASSGDDDDSSMAAGNSHGTNDDDNGDSETDGEDSADDDTTGAAHDSSDDNSGKDNSGKDNSGKDDSDATAEADDASARAEADKARRKAEAEKAKAEAEEARAEAEEAKAKGKAFKPKIERFNISVGNKRDFDMLRYLPQARMHARRILPDAYFYRLDAKGVKSNGRLDLLKSPKHYATYRFFSPRAHKRPADLAPGLDWEPKCVVYVNIQPGVSTVYLTSICSDKGERRQPRPRCTPKKLWDKAIGRGAPSNGYAEFNYYGGFGGGMARSYFEIPGTKFDFRGCH